MRCAKPIYSVFQEYFKPGKSDNNSDNRDHNDGDDDDNPNVWESRVRYRRFRRMRINYQRRQSLRSTSHILRP